MRIMGKDGAFPAQLLCRKGIAWEDFSSWWNVVRSKGFSFLRREATFSLAGLNDAGMSHYLHYFDSFPDFDFALALV